MPDSQYLAHTLKGKAPIHGHSFPLSPNSNPTIVGLRIPPLVQTDDHRDDESDIDTWGDVDSVGLAVCQDLAQIDHVTVDLGDDGAVSLICDLGVAVEEAALHKQLLLAAAGYGVLEDTLGLGS